MKKNSTVQESSAASRAPRSANSIDVAELISQFQLFVNHEVWIDRNALVL